MRDVKLLVRSIFSEIDPVKVGKELLQKSPEATKARSYFTMWEYLFGKPATAGDSEAAEEESPLFQFSTSAPRPNYPVDPNSEDQRNKAMCRNSLAGAAAAASAAPRRTDQED